jgi:hypothetical protein
MSAQLPPKRLATAPPTGTDTLAVRERYIRRRHRRITDRGWITMWATVSALIGWLFIVGFAGLGH